jgi:rare lipoprotein A
MKTLLIMLLLSLSSFANQTGMASHYSVKSNGGTRTASGERLCDKSFTAAHRSLKFGTQVKVTNLRNNKSVVVRINNRGPFVPGRVIDVSQAAAHSLGFHKQGVTRVKVEVIKK